MNRAERRRGTAQVKAKPDHRRTIVYATLAVLAIAVIAAIGFASRTPKTASEAPMFAQLNVGDAAPAIDVATTGGPLKVPAADRKPVLLEVFATWCPHCQHETSILNDLYERYGAQVHFAAVSGSPYAMDGTSPASAVDVMNFVQRFKVRYPVAYDGDLGVAKKYLQGGYPTIVVIDRNGKLASIRSGEIAEKTLVDAVNAALKG